MIKLTEKLSAREYVWEHRIRQRIALERIVLTVGNPKEKYRAKQFLDAMEDAYPDLLEAAEQLALDFDNDGQASPELFEDSEYSEAKGRKTALKFPQDVLWEERIVKRAVREFHELFHPCEDTFNNAIKGLQYLSSLHPQLFTSARAQAVKSREQILTCELYCKCDCISPENSQPADSFMLADRGRFNAVSRRVMTAMQSLGDDDDERRAEWQFFMERIGEVAPEMLVA